MEMLLPTLPQAVALVAIGMLAGVIRGLTGFGAALVLVPALSLLLDPAAAVAVNIVTITASNLPLVLGARGQADRRTVGLFFAGCLVALPAGVWLLTHLPAGILKDAIGVCVIAAALLLARPQFRLPSAGAGLKLGAGAASGLMTGSVGMGGPPVILLLLALPIPPESARATLILYFALLNMASLAMLAVGGLVTAQVLVWGAIMVGPAMLADRWGTWLFHRGGSAHFRPIAIALLVATGVAALAG